MKKKPLKNTTTIVAPALERLVESVIKEMHHESGPYDLSELGSQPILTDYNSIEELYKIVRKDIYEALKVSDPRAAFDAIRNGLVKAARYGFVTGHDTAMSECEQEMSKEYHRQVDENKSNA